MRDIIDAEIEALQAQINEEHRAIKERLMTAKTRRGHPETSKRAAITLRQGLSKMRQKVLTVLSEHPEGLTQSELREICNKRFGERSESTYRSRLPELQQLGYATKLQDTRRNSRGSVEHIWRATIPSGVP